MQRVTLTPEQILELLDLHKRWRQGDAKGKRFRLPEGADLEGAYLRGADLRGADLEGADLRGADLEGADLRGAYLRGADLEGAYLRGADLRGADLEGAYLRGADLRGAYLRGAYLRGAYLEGAYLRGAYLEGAYLRGADLRGADLEGAKVPEGFDQSQYLGPGPREDLWNVLDAAPDEAAGLRLALVEGRINGSVYEGECACLVGTIANLRGVSPEALPDPIKPNVSRPAEIWFLSIRKGDTPDNHAGARRAVQWIDEWTQKRAEAMAANPAGGGA